MGTAAVWAVWAVWAADSGETRSVPIRLWSGSPVADQERPYNSPSHLGPLGAAVQEVRPCNACGCASGCGGDAWQWWSMPSASVLWSSMEIVVVASPGTLLLWQRLVFVWYVWYMSGGTCLVDFLVLFARLSQVCQGGAGQESFGAQQCPRTAVPPWLVAGHGVGLCALEYGLSAMLTHTGFVLLTLVGSQLGHNLRDRFLWNSFPVWNAYTEPVYPHPQAVATGTVCLGCQWWRRSQVI